MTISIAPHASRLGRAALCAALTALALLPGCGGGSNPVTFALCGNGVIDPGEQCDDGNPQNADNGPCLSTCQLAVCGDGFVNKDAEECDTDNFAGATCASLGFDRGTLLCDPSCLFDTSACGPMFTPTSTRTPTPTQPTATPTLPNLPTPTPTPEPCGNGLIEPGEACMECPADQTCQGCLPGEPCEVCPQDCEVLPCTPTTTSFTIQVNLSLPSGQNVGTVGVLVGYRSDVVSLPASGLGVRIGNLQPGGNRFVQNFGYAFQYLYSLPTGLNSGGLFTLRFDECQDGASPTEADFSCIMQACTGNAGEVDGCLCSVEVP